MVIGHNKGKTDTDHDLIREESDEKSTDSVETKPENICEHDKTRK